MAAGDVFGAITAYLRSSGLPVEERAEEDWAAVRAFGESGEWPLVVQWFEDRSAVAAYSILPFNVPPEHREALALFLTRLNWGLVAGNFELDLDDGQVRFKTMAEVLEDPLTEAALKPLVGGNMLTVDRYLPVIRAVAHGDESAAEAWAAAEG